MTPAAYNNNLTTDLIAMAAMSVHTILFTNVTINFPDSIKYTHTV